MSIFSANDVSNFRTDRLLRAASTYWPNVTLSDAYLLQQLQAAEAYVARRLRVCLEPTQVFPWSPSTSDLSGLPTGMPWLEEPGYDYDPQFFSSGRWGYIITRYRPIISVQLIQFAYPVPTQSFFPIPQEWIRLEKKHGQINLVPASASFAAPLNAFMLQAVGGGDMIPFMLQVQYQTGLQNVRTDPQWADLVDVIYKQAVLNILDENFTPQSGSISADGLSQSMSLDADKYRDAIELKLTGPKGSHGGLWAAIHGIPLGIAGVTV